MTSGESRDRNETDRTRYNGQTVEDHVTIWLQKAMKREGREEKGRSNLLSDATLAKLCVYSHLRLLFEMGRFRISFFEVCAQGVPRRLQAAVICIHAQNTHS